MKKCFFVITIIITSFFGVGFTQEILLSSDSTNIDINNPLGITISVTEAPRNGTITLDGIDKFDVLGQSTANTLQVVNGVRKQTTQLQLQVKAKESGNFVLGPAHIQGNDEIESNIIEVEVTGEKLFVNGAPQGWTSVPSVTEKNTKSDSLPTKGENEKIELIEKAILPLRLPVVVFFFLLILGIFFLLKKRRSIEKSYDIDLINNELSDDGFIELGTIPSIDDQSYFDKVLLRISKWIELQTGQQSIGKSPQELQTIRNEYGDNTSENTSVITILQYIQQGLYQGDESTKEQLHTLLQSL